MTLEDAQELVEKQNGTLSVEQISDLLCSLIEGPERLKPEWGNCKRGCVPSYLDADGYCSPQCAQGGRRGAL
jgi:hypothetical protein